MSAKKIVITSDRSPNDLNKFEDRLKTYDGRHTLMSSDLKFELNYLRET